MGLDIGTNINQYKIVSRLGAGGMGEVYLAEDEKLRRKVALKLLSKDVTKNEDWILRFEQEARAASSLNHPNIITIYEVGQTGESHFISTEFISGVTLRQYLKQNILATTEILEIVIQISGALVAAHEAGIIHRDIKPENVMLRPDGYVKVVDFGLAKFTEQPRSTGASRSDPDADTESDVNEAAANKVPLITNPGTVMGTVSYMSPEQATGIEIDARTDIFSLGVLLYELVSGRLPFEGTTPNDVIAAIIHKKQRRLVRFSPDVPAELERIVEKALTKKRDDRYQSLKDMQIDLRRLKRQLDLNEEIDPPEPVPSGEPVSGSGDATKLPTGEATIPVNEISVQRNASSAEYIVSGIRQHKKIVLIVMGLIIAAAIGVWYYIRTRPIESIAVLPFNVSGVETRMDQLSEEMTEGIIRDLAKLPGLRVMSSSAVRQYKARSVDPQSIGRELNVRAILIVRVFNRDESILVSADLIDTRDGRQVWGVQRPVMVADTSLVPNEIVAAISEIIGVKLDASEKKKREAETLYLKGRNAWNKRTADKINEAMGYFNQALALAPDSAQALAGLADCYNMLGTYGVNSPAESFPLARDAAIKALAHDDNLAEGHAALAYATFRNKWDWQEAETEFKEAIRLNEKYASAHQWYANLLAARGRFDEAIKETQRTQQLDNSLIIYSHFGLVYYFGHRFDEAIAECQKALKLDRTFFVAHRYLGLSYAQKGMYDEALAEFGQALALNSSPLLRAEYANALALSGKTDRARAELAALIELSKQKYISAYHIAAIYVGLKDKDRAFEWLDKAFIQRADWMVFLRVDPRFESLHSDPRFTEMLRRMNLLD